MSERDQHDGSSSEHRRFTAEPARYCVRNAIGRAAEQEIAWGLSWGTPVKEQHNTAGINSFRHNVTERKESNRPDLPIRAWSRGE